MIKNIPGFWRASACFVLLACLLYSCTTTKNSYYFKTLQKDTTINGFVTNDFESKIRVGDNLAIVASSLSAEEDALFNKSAAAVPGPTSVSTTTIQGFIVQDNGKVLLHRLGEVQAAGLTRKQLAAFIRNAMLPYMKDPIVNVNYLNHKVTIMGDVTRPQVLSLPEEQISIIDALVLSGDITATGKRDKVMVIREENNQKMVKMLNLEDHSILTSPWYYVQPNDIVYVRPDFEKAEKDLKRQRLQSSLSLVVSGISLVIIVIDRIFR